jgi:hypothetical protein
MNLRILVVFGWLAFTLSSCEKAETAVTLPPRTGAQPGRVVLGEHYQTQVFWDLEKNQSVKTSACESWDLAFDASVSGSQVRMNGGKGITLYNTHRTDFNAVTGLPDGFQDTDWGFDDPKGRPEGNYVGAWWNSATGESKQDIFIAKAGDFDLYKIQLLSVTEGGYQFQVAPLATPSGTTVTLPKEAGYNYVYYSFANGPVPQPDAPQADWDLVFTRYRYIYYNYNNTGYDFPYLVTGVMLNPYKVLAAADSLTPFAQATLEQAQRATFSSDQDVIGGMNWKLYDFGTSRFLVNPKWVYYLKTRNHQLYKLHFLDFYTNGVKGAPSFESERLQ